MWGSATFRLLRWLTDYSAMLTEHKGAAARITAALGDPGSPFAAKCQTYLNANQRLIDALDSALRPGVEAIQISRLVGGVAAVADNSALPAESEGIDARNRRRRTARSLTAAGNAFAATPPASAAQSGLMFWLRVKKFVGSYLRLSVLSRSYLPSP